MVTGDGQKIRSNLDRLTAPEKTADALGWLADQEADGTGRRDAGLDYLLATTYGAVVWGKKSGEQWALYNGTQLPAAELIELRAFGQAAEVFVWRDATGLHARRRTDGIGDEVDALDESQLLWGTEIDPDAQAPAGFTPLRDGDQGLRHAPPLVFDAGYFVTQERNEQGELNKGYGHRPTRLQLRHYVGRDQATGLARIVDSRLVSVYSRPVDAAKETKEDES